MQREIIVISIFLILFYKTVDDVKTRNIPLGNDTRFKYDTKQAMFLHKSLDKKEKLRNANANHISKI